MNDLEMVQKYWPDRGIFQGSARAYIRFCEQPQPTWDDLEKPLWQLFFQSLTTTDLLVLDVGTGPGKLIDVLLEAGILPEHILAMEPNPILIEYLLNRKLGIGCMKDSAVELGHELLQHAEIDLITANMVVNHLTTEQFCEFIANARGALRAKGILAYTIPHPGSKAQKYHIDHRKKEALFEEDAPWGGRVYYYHRSEEYQRHLLQQYGFSVITIEWGYASATPENIVTEYDGYFYKDKLKPKRLLVIAEKQ